MYDAVSKWNVHGFVSALNTLRAVNMGRYDSISYTRYFVYLMCHTLLNCCGYLSQE